MRAIVGYLLGAVLMAVVGVLCLAFARLDREIAQASQGVVAGNYDAPHDTYDKAERYYEQASRIPWVGNSAANDMHARGAAIHYWQRQYRDVIPEGDDPMGNVPADNVDLQFVVANSIYRDAASHAKDRPSALAALDAGISGYREVLKNAAEHRDASYNYEYLLRLRDEVEQGRKKAPLPSEPTSPQGRPGNLPLEGDMAKFKVYVPLEQQEINKTDAAGAAKGTPIKRKG